MATLLLNLRHVPDDEAEAVRRLLSEHGLDYYETPPNRWAISMGAIWLRDDERAAEAKALLADYQAERAAAARQAHAEAVAAGRAETILARVRARPVATLVRLAGIAFILYVSLIPFTGLLD